MSRERERKPTATTYARGIRARSKWSLKTRKCVYNNKRNAEYLIVKTQVIWENYLKELFVENREKEGSPGEITLRGDIKMKRLKIK